MTTATKRLPAHAQDDRCYRYGCRRAECRDTYRNVRKYADLRRSKGIPGHASGPRVAAHLRAVIDSGKTRLQIAAESGVSERAIRYILAGQPEVQLAKAAVLLAVQPLAATPRVDSTGTRRRIEALATLGWQVTHTADETGISRRYAFDILRGIVPLVDRGVADRMAAIYRAKASRPGPSLFTRNHAARQGWHGPLDWDDIDDPAAQPDAEDVPDLQLKRDELAEIRRDEIWLLATAGHTDDEIAARIGMAAKSVHTIRAELRTGKRRDRTKAAA